MTDRASMYGNASILPLYSSLPFGLETDFVRVGSVAQKICPVFSDVFHSD